MMTPQATMFDSLRKSIDASVNVQLSAPMQWTATIGGINITIIQREHVYVISTMLDAFKTREQFATIDAAKRHIVECAYNVWLQLNTVFDIMSVADIAAQQSAQNVTLRKQVADLQAELSERLQEQVYDKHILGRRKTAAKEHRTEFIDVEKLIVISIMSQYRLLSTQDNAPDSRKSLAIAKRDNRRATAEHNIQVVQSLYEDALNAGILQQWRLDGGIQRLRKQAFILHCVVHLQIPLVHISKAIDANYQSLSTTYKKLLNKSDEQLQKIFDTWPELKLTVEDITKHRNEQHNKQSDLA
jgi:hypothetical protein